MSYLVHDDDEKGIKRNGGDEKEEERAVKRATLQTEETEEVRVSNELAQNQFEGAAASIGEVLTQKDATEQDLSNAVTASQEERDSEERRRNAQAMLLNTPWGAMLQSAPPTPEINRKDNGEEKEPEDAETSSDEE
jgi:hypothetical protein